MSESMCAPARFPRLPAIASAEQGFAGGNVTIPHKEAAFAAVDRRDRAGRAGQGGQHALARGRRCSGATTRTSRALWTISTRAWGQAGHEHVDTALVIGAGGAARAVVAGLQDRASAAYRRRQPHGVEGRRARRANSARIGARPSWRRSWADLDGLVAEADLIVNTTSLGMSRPAAARPRSRAGLPRTPS